MAACLLTGSADLARNSAPLRRQVLLSVTKRPAPYWEIFFTDYAALPGRVTIGSTYEVAFTVVGHAEPKSAEVSAALTSPVASEALPVERVSLGSAGRGQGRVAFVAPSGGTAYRLVIAVVGGPSISWLIPTPTA